jgi:hypothetical protein
MGTYIIILRDLWVGRTKTQSNQTTNTKLKRTLEIETDSIISQDSPPVFNGDNYEAWAIRMTVHLETLDL